MKESIVSTPNITDPLFPRVETIESVTKTIKYSYGMSKNTGNWPALQLKVRLVLAGFHHLMKNGVYYIH
jgi:hypothetical protein